MTPLALGIETSCDETAVALVDGRGTIHANVVASQLPLHRRYGGVVPELASRRHVERILPVLEQALEEAGAGPGDVDLVAVTRVPGLLGALMVGVTAAKALALAWNRPLVGVHHLAGHIVAGFLRPRAGATADEAARGAAPGTSPGSHVSRREAPHGAPSPGGPANPDGCGPPWRQGPWPAVCLVVSGGHTDLFALDGDGEVRLLGRTRDDAAGEAFDKVARLLGLEYPGGPALERLARGGDPDAVPFPRALRDDLDFSFSGLKTAVAYHLQDARRRGRSPDPADVAASFQQAVVEVLVEKTVRAVERTGARRVILGGGVAANGALRRGLRERLEPLGVPLVVPPPELCTDNAAMIAAAGLARFLRGERDGLDLDVAAREELTRL